MAEIGKRVGTRQYLATHQLDTLSGDAKDLVERGKALLPDRGVLANANIVRLDTVRKEVSFLSYPELGLAPFPALKSSWRVDLVTNLVNLRRYDASLNPPILHRTELLLADDHPAKPLCETLTKDCENLGLFADSNRIGFQQQWEELIESRGYQVTGFNLTPLGNTSAVSDSDEQPAESLFKGVARHLTALSRNGLSAPVQRLIADQLLDRQSSFFDYGCGRGDDLAALESNGFSVLGGWDPHYRPEAPRMVADVVNLGFVINVIEDRAERFLALENAFALTRKVLAVSAMLGSNDSSKGREFRDGVITSRQTFQKYFSQNELREFIESVLDVEAYPAAPGVFYVFRDQDLEQRYLLRRTSNGARVRQVLLQFPRKPPNPVRQKPLREPRENIVREKVIPETVLADLERMWRVALDLGRPPDEQEFESAEMLVSHFKSFKRAWSSCVERHDAEVLAAAAHGRREDILVMFALRQFDRRRRFGSLEPRLARDIKALFGKVATAEAAATQLLFSLQDITVIDAACRSAATAGLGWLDPGESLQLHSSMINRLPAALRVYIGCASIMAGDLSSFDLIKAHIQSGKVSLLAYDDFDGKAFPLLQRRIKVRLRDQQLDVFEYDTDHPPTVLFRKSRYINEEFANYEQQVQIEDAVEQLGLFDLNGYGPTENEFKKRLASRRYEVLGHALVRSSDIPNLDETCGANYRFRDLVECGDTWRTKQIDNVPRSPETYNALCDLAWEVLDPVIDYFGAIELTYGFASTALTKHISAGIAPDLDQHGACDRTTRGKQICIRGGAAVDFLVRDEDMVEVARWVGTHCRFDRMYVYGNDRPIHVSVGPENNREVVRMEMRGSRRVPRVTSLDAL